GLQHLLDMAGPGMTAADIDADFIRGHVIKYLGVGAVTVGGFVSLLKSFPTIISSFSTGFKQILKRGRKDDGEAEKRTDQELPMWVVLVGAILIILVIWAYPNTGLNPLAIAMVVIFGFLFVVVAARIVGLVGSSSSPVSGMTIATLLVTCLMLTAFGISGAEGMVAAMSVGAVVCIAVCLSGDIAQDLKTGFLLGATPKKMQIMEFVGLFFPALTMGFILFLLGDTYGFVESPEHPNPLLAPQANIMAAVVNGILGGVLPWEYIIAGGMIALAVEFLGIGSLPFAIGLYLPLSLSTPIMAGGLLSLLVKRTSMDVVHHKSREQKGILFASGLVAGDALVGVAIALMFAGASSLAFLDKYRIFSNQYDTISIFGAPWNDILSLMFFGILMLVFWRFTFVKKR
ncbi:MAG: oligopeptide transporter, OPT family, partial [candidate division Zixibacteria bacterium]|nr:oligopeptide transporter, OPT family [candidate division Zixibacteria bacterium]